MSAASILHYRFPRGRRTLRARVAAPELSPLLESFYRGYRCHDVEADGPCTISLKRENGSYWLAGPSGDWRAEDVGEALLYYESELTGALLEDAGAFVHLHGAALSHGSRCLLLVGPSGAGKSTLTLGLHLGGMKALADDALLIEPGKGRVYPFERSIRVHRAGLDELGVEPEAVPGARYCAPYLWLPPQGAEAPDSGPQQPAAITFLASSERTRLVRLGATETLKELLIARLSRSAGRDFECLARLAGKVPGYRLEYGRLSEALSELQRWSEVSSGL